MRYGNNLIEMMDSVKGLEGGGAVKVEDCKAPETANNTHPILHVNRPQQFFKTGGF